MAKQKTRKKAAKFGQIPDTGENVMRAVVMTPPKRADERDYAKRVKN